MRDQGRGKYRQIIKEKSKRVTGERRKLLKRNVKQGIGVFRKGFESKKK